MPTAGPPPKAAEGQGLHGLVKSYNGAKGFGFIAAPDVQGDVYFKGDGGDFGEGMPVSFYVKWTPDGKPQARGVVPGLQSGQTCVGTVRSYNPNKGYGFLAL